MTSVYAMNSGLMPLGVLPTAVVAESPGIRAATGVLAVAVVMLFWRRETRRMA